MIIMVFLNLGLNLAYNQTLAVFNSSKIHPENRPTHLKMSTWKNPQCCSNRLLFVWVTILFWELSGKSWFWHESG